MENKKMGLAWKSLHLIKFEWQVAKCGYVIQSPIDTFSDCNALISAWPEIQTWGLLRMANENALTNGTQSVLDDRKAHRIAPIDPTPQYENIMPLRRRFDLQKEEELLFVHFQKIDTRDDTSIINFVNLFGLLIDHEYTQYNTRKFELMSNKLNFFKKEVRDFQTIFGLRECLHHSHQNVGEYLNYYFEKRFQCDDSNFKNSEIDFLCALLSKRVTSLRANEKWYLIDDEVKRRVDKVLSEAEKSSAYDNDPYYLNDYLTYQKNNAGYPLDGATVSDLDFTDYLEKREELVDPVKIGYYYLNKWLRYKLGRFHALPQVQDVEIPSYPQSLLAAIYLQFSNSLEDNSSIDFCSICQKYDIRSRTPEEELKIYEERERNGHSDEITIKEWHDFTDKYGKFAYHERCSRNLQKRIRERKVGVEGLREKFGDSLKWKKPYNPKKPITLGPRILMNIEVEYEAKGEEAALCYLRKTLENMEWL